MTDPVNGECMCDTCPKRETELSCDGCFAREESKRRDAEAKLAQAFTLERLEAQVARTQGRGDGKGIGLALFTSLEEEAREVAELFNLTPSMGMAEWREALKLELGDVLNVVTAIAMHAGFTLREVAEANDAKMRARMPEGCGE